MVRRLMTTFIFLIVHYAREYTGHILRMPIQSITQQGRLYNSDVTIMRKLTDL